MNIESQTSRPITILLALLALALCGISLARADYPATVLGDNPLAYYRLSQTAAPVTDVATNSGSLGASGNGVYTIGAGHQATGAIVGDNDTAAHFTAVDTNTDDGGVPVIVPYAPDFNPSGSFTIEAWLRPTEDGNGNAQSPLYNRDPSDSSPNRVGWDFFQRASNTGWNFRMFNGNGHSRVFDVTGGPYVVGQWCHLVAVYDAAAPSVTLYLNGQQVAFSSSPSGSFNPNTVFPLSIGGYSDASQNPFVGDIDEVAIYASALSPIQVSSHYQNGTNVARSVAYSTLINSDGAVEYLRLDEPPQNVVSNAGSLTAAGNAEFGAYVSPGQAGPQPPADLGFDAANTAAYFDGSAAFLELGNPAGLNFSGQITLEAWVSSSAAPAPTGGYGDIIAHGYSDDYYETSLRVDDSSGTPAYSVGNYTPTGGQTAAAAIPAEDLGGGTWVHLVGTYDGAKWNLYRNGVWVASQADSVGAVIVTNANWAIGARGRWKTMDVLTPALARQFQGTLDEPAIYNHALTPAQVLTHYLLGAYNTNNIAPIIYAQPSSLTTRVGITATFTVGAASTTMLSYQWYHGASLLAGMTNASLVLSNVQTAAAGNYSVAISNSAGSTNSATAALTFVTPSPYAALVLAASPSAFYPLDELTGTTAYDFSGNGNNGTYQSAPTLGAAGPSAYIPSAAGFDGSSQWVDLGNPSVLNFAGPITLEAWIQPTASELSLADVLGHGYDGATGHETTLRLDGDSSYYIGAYPGYNLTGGDPGASAGQWVHLVGTYDGAAWNLYTNGAPVSSTPATGSGALAAQSDWAIANGTGYSAGRYFQGPMAQVAFYNYALTPLQIWTHYMMGAFGNANVPPQIYSQSAPQTNYIGTTLSVSALSVSALRYQWLSNGVPIMGATNSQLSLAFAGLVDYSVNITNSYGSTNIDVGTVDVLAGLAQTQCNPVNFGSLAWNVPSSWDTLKLPHYPLNLPNYGNFGEAINYVSIAHDAYYFYFRFHCVAPQFSGDYYMWLDTDVNPFTGMRGWTGLNAVGAEYWVQGAALEQAGVGLVTWLSWAQTGDATSTVEQRDIIFSIPRSELTANSFDWTLQLFSNANSANADWYPESANSQSGSLFRYTTDTSYWSNRTIAASVSGGSLTLTWATGTLQQADTVAGPYSDVSGATGPQYAVPAGAPKKFYRVRF